MPFSDENNCVILPNISVEWSGHLLRIEIYGTVSDIRQAFIIVVQLL